MCNPNTDFSDFKAHADIPDVTLIQLRFLYNFAWGLLDSNYNKMLISLPCLSVAKFGQSSFCEI